MKTQRRSAIPNKMYFLETKEDLFSEAIKTTKHSHSGKNTTGFLGIFVKLPLRLLFLFHVLQTVDSDANSPLFDGSKIHKS